MLIILVQRQDIYCNFVEYLNQIKALHGVRELKQWVNGSVPEHANESYFRYESDKEYWIDKFETTRRDRARRKKPKGFLEIIH